MSEIPRPEEENNPESEVEKKLAKLRSLKGKSSELADEISAYLQDEGTKTDWSDVLNAWSKLDEYLSREARMLSKETEIGSVDERLNELVRKEQGWDAKKQKKTGKGGLSPEEKDELKKLSDSFEELGGRNRLQELRGDK